MVTGAGKPKASLALQSGEVERDREHRGGGDVVHVHVGGHFVLPGIHVIAFARARAALRQ